MGYITLRAIGRIAFYFSVTLIISGCGSFHKNDRILIIVSNVENMGDPQEHFAGNNLWEVAPPYHIFVSHGYDVDFMSPTGGVVPFSMDPMGISSYTIKYENFNEKVRSSLIPSEVNPEDYSAVFIGGGYGPLFDVSEDNKIQEIIAKIYESNGVVGGCGHGPGAFANVKLSDGSFMVSGKTVVGFPNSTEETKNWAKNGTLLPYKVEDQLRKHGALFKSKEELNDKADVIVNQRIVSTMFLPSAAIVAKEMINSIEKRAVN